MLRQQRRRWLRASDIAAGQKRRSCVLEGGDESGHNDDELGIEGEKEGEEKEDEARLLGGQGEAALKKMCLPWSGRGRREEGGDVDVD